MTYDTNKANAETNEQDVELEEVTEQIAPSAESIDATSTGDTETKQAPTPEEHLVSHDDVSQTTDKEDIEDGAAQAENANATDDISEDMHSASSIETVQAADASDTTPVLDSDSEEDDDGFSDGERDEAKIAEAVDADDGEHAADDVCKISDKAMETIEDKDASERTQRSDFDIPDDFTPQQLPTSSQMVSSNTPVDDNGLLARLIRLSVDNEILTVATTNDSKALASCFIPKDAFTKSPINACIKFAALKNVMECAKDEQAVISIVAYDPSDPASGVYYDSKKKSIAGWKSTGYCKARKHIVDAIAAVQLWQALPLLEYKRGI